MERKWIAVSLAAIGVSIAVDLYDATQSRAHAQGGSPGNLPQGNNLSNAGCTDEDKLRSTEGAISTEITFVNRSAGAIRIYWLNYQGKRVYYAEIVAGPQL